MKHLYIPFILLGFLMLNACVREDISGCFSSEEGTLKIDFSYSTLEDGNEFSKRIEQVDLLLFRETGEFLQHIPLDKQRLDSLPAVELSLDPGLYYVVAWGNKGEHSELSIYDDIANLHNVRLMHTGRETTDPLYYAPRKSSFLSTDYSLYEMTVKPKQTTEKELDFMTAYYTVNVSVRILEEIVKEEDLSVEVLNLSQGYDLHLVTQANTNTLRRQPTPTQIAGQTGELLMASFDTPHFENQNPVEVYIYEKENTEPLCAISMQQFLAEYSYFLRAGNYTVIDIYVEIGPSGIKILLPSWANNGLEGEF